MRKIVAAHVSDRLTTGSGPMTGDKCQMSRIHPARKKKETQEEEVAYPEDGSRAP